MDIVARKRRMQGYSVLSHRMGCFRTSHRKLRHQESHTSRDRNGAEHRPLYRAAQISRTQLRLGQNNKYDRSDYFKWTQWIFLKLYEKGLAYKKEMSVNFCTSCKVVLANEEVVNGVCERCGSEVVHKVKSQWMPKITAYADRLIDDLKDLDFIERVKTQEINWIGRSYGAEVDFQTSAGDKAYRLYNTSRYAFSVLLIWLSLPSMLL